jgi:mRNA interferase MazF
MVQVAHMRGDIWLAELPEVIGSVQAGIRPVIIISNNLGNSFSTTVTVACVTSQCKKPDIPTHVPVSSPFLQKDSQILLEQILTVDKSQLINRIGKVSKEDQDRIDKAVKVQLAIKNDSNNA